MILKIIIEQINNEIIMAMQKSKIMLKIVTSTTFLNVSALYFFYEKNFELPENLNFTL